MTKHAFELWWAKRRGTTVAQLHEAGRGAERCMCGDAACKGWVMVNTGKRRDGNS